MMLGKEEVGTLFIQVCGARGLPYDKEAAADHPSTYIKFTVNDMKYKTCVVEKSTSPQWEEQFELPVTPTILSHETIVFTVCRKRKVYGTQFVASISFPLAGLVRGIIHDGWYPLYTVASDLHVNAELHLRLLCPTLGRPTPQADRWKMTHSLMCDPAHRTCSKRHDEDYDQYERRSSTLTSPLLTHQVSYLSSGANSYRSPKVAGDPSSKPFSTCSSPNTKVRYRGPISPLAEPI